MLKNSVRDSKKTPHFTITNIMWLMMFTEMIAVYTENYSKSIHTECSCNYWYNIWYIYHKALNG
jgi:hypothetical protein